MSIATRFINRKPAGNFHHAVRIAERCELPLNLLVTINFSHIACDFQLINPAFQRVRGLYGKWARRPSAKSCGKSVPPTFGYVWEQPTKLGKPHCHWPVHVPKDRQDEFISKVPCWLEQAAGTILDARALDIRPIDNPFGLQQYMLKGMEPVAAGYYGIDAEDQGVIPWRRCGFSKNLGPTQKRILRAHGKYPPARPWIPGLFKKL